MFELLLITIIGAVGLSISLSIVGNFLIWKKISYMGDSIAHSSILGATISIVLGHDSTFYILVVCFSFAIIIDTLQKYIKIATETILIYNTQLALSISLMIVAIAQPSQSIESFFFGDILSINVLDLIYIYILALFTITYFVLKWDKLILSTINTQVALSEGAIKRYDNIIFIFITSAIISTSIKFAGALLIPSLLIIPGILANTFAKSPFNSIMISIFTSIFGILSGITISYFINIPLGAAISFTLIAIISIRVIYVIRLRYKT